MPIYKKEKSGSDGQEKNRVKKRLKQTQNDHVKILKKNFNFKEIFAFVFKVVLQFKTTKLE